MRAAHAAETSGQNPFAFPVTAEVTPAHFGEGLVRALHDALRADIDPRPGRHLAVHHEALAIEFVKVSPRRPFRHEVGVRKQYARRVGVRLEHTDRFTRLHEQCFVLFETAQRFDNLVVALPIARRAADAAVHHKLFRVLSNIWIEIVHQHAQCCFREPALAAQLFSTRGADHARCVVTRVH